MLTYKIKHPEPVVVQPQSTYARGATYGSRKTAWPKMVYADWVERVKKEHKVGDLITLTINEYKQNVIPYYYEITGIGEIHYLVDFDTYFNEPMAIHCLTQHNFAVSKCPSAIRKLTPEEMQLVHLQHTPDNRALC